MTYPAAAAAAPGAAAKRQPMLPGAAAAAKRQPILLPGFDRLKQLTMDFKTISFGTAWLRRIYTNDQDPSIQARLAAEEPWMRDRRLQEIRYGNNITLLFKACYFCREFHGSESLWTAISRVFGISSQVAESVADLFVEARAIYLSNHSPAGGTAPLSTEATHWVDKWTSFLDEPDHPTSSRGRDVFAVVDDFFRREKASNGDLACILSKGIDRIDVDPPTAPRALRKRSPSPSASQWAPNAKKRIISRDVDEPTYDHTPGRARSQSSVSGSQPSSQAKQEPHDAMLNTNSRQNQIDQLHRTSQEEPYFELKIRGQSERDNRNSPRNQDHHWSKADECEALAQSNMELQDRVESLEKERREAARAQKDRDDAIRALQVKFTTLEKKSAAADAQSSWNDKLVREMQTMTEKLATQAEKLQKMGKQLEVSNQTTQRMQATISSLQKNEATRAQPAGDGVAMQGAPIGAATAETKAGQEGPPATQKRELPEMQVRISSLEAKCVFFNDLHKKVREMQAEIAAQKNKNTGQTPESAREPYKQDTSTRLRAAEEGMEKQARAAQQMTDRVVALEEQAFIRSTRIESLESRPDPAKDISQLKSRVSKMAEDQDNNLNRLLSSLSTVQKSFEAIKGSVQGLSKGLDEVGDLPFVKAISDSIAEMQARIAHVEEHGTEISKRLDDMEVSQDALTLQDHSSRIDELSQSLEPLKTLPLSLARSDDVEALRADLKALSEKQTSATQPVGYDEKAFASIMNKFQGLSSRMTGLNEVLQQHANELRSRSGQLLYTTGDTVHDGEQITISAVIDSLCQRVGVIENGFQIMKDAMFSRRR